MCWEKLPSATSRPSSGSRVKVMRPPTLKSAESQQSLAQKSDTLKSSNLGVTGCQKACNCTKEHVDPSCRGKCVGQWAKNTSRVAQKGLKIALPMSPDRRNVLSSRTFRL